VTAYEMTEVLGAIAYKDWAISLGHDDNRPYLQVAFHADGVVHHGRKWFLSRHMTKSEVVQTALMAVLAAEEHEAREHFRYRGRAIFGPHFNVDVLHAMADGTNQETRRPKEPSFLADPMAAAAPKAVTG
jgi:hypothetical protein